MQNKRKPWYRYTSASFKIKTDTYCAVEIKATVLLVSKMVTYQSAVCSKGHVAELFIERKMQSQTHKHAAQHELLSFC